MGLLAQTVLDAGGVVHGIMPQNLYDRGAGHPGLTDFEVVPNMSIRKQRMLELSDGCIALPGGPGTLEEIAERFLGPASVTMKILVFFTMLTDSTIQSNKCSRIWSIKTS